MATSHLNRFLYSYLTLNNATEGHTPVLSCIVVALFQRFLPVTVARFANALCSARFLATGRTADLGHAYPEKTFSKGAHALLNAI